MNTDGFAFDVFLSHSSKDKDVVGSLARKLRGDGLRVWFDEWEIGVGDVIPYRIELGLERSRVLLLVMSQNAFGSDWVQLESGTFRFRDPLNKGRRFIPIRLDEAEIPGSLRQVLYVHWMAHERNDENYKKILDACKPPLAPPPPKAGRLQRVTATNKTHLPLHSISAYAFSKRGDTAIFARYDGAICLWDVEKNKQIGEALEGHNAQVTGLAWDEDRGLVVSGGSDKTVRIWDLSTRKCLTRFEGHRGRITDVCWFNQIAVSCSTDTSIRVWDFDSGIEFRTLRGHTHDVNAIAIHDTILVSAGRDRTIRIWDLTTYRCLRVLEGHVAAVRCLQFSADGHSLLSGSEDNTIKLWNVATGLCLRTFEGHTDKVLDVVWHANQTLFLSSSGDMTVRLWDAAGGICLSVLDGHTRDVLAVSWRVDQESAVSGDISEVRRWTIEPKLLVTKERLVLEPAGQGAAAEQIQYTNAKVLLVGDSGAGKTGLSRRLASNTWEPTFSTVGAWATQWSLPIDRTGDSEREIWLWDFGGQADQRFIHQLYMDETALAVLVFDGQKTDTFETLNQWDQDLRRASSKQFAKLLVAGRIDAGHVRARRSDIQEFMAEKGFKAYVETSAKTSIGCDELREKIIEGIDWDAIPWRSSPVLFKRLKEQIVKLKDDGRVLMRVNELRDYLRLTLSGSDSQFNDAELKAVLSLLAGPGVVVELEFGGWVLFQPELINAYGQAVIQTMRADQSELGCLSEERVLNGDLEYAGFTRISRDDERFVLLAMHQLFLERGLCSRELTETDVLLVFPSYYKRHRPELSGHPAVVVSYKFDGVVDEIYSTLVVRLHHTNQFSRQQLWQDAAEFQTKLGPRIGVKLSRRQTDAAGRLDVYCEPSASLADRLIFIKYVHEHLRQKALNVVRRRHYICACKNPIADVDAAEKRRDEGKQDVGCSYCDARVTLWDDLELQYANPVTERKVRGLDEKADVELDNESKERALVGEVISAVALAGQIAREKSVSDHGIDMEIEFKDDRGRATGELIFLQLKSGDSYLRKTVDGRETFQIQKQFHVEYWTKQKVPVLLVIRDSSGEIRWMEIRKYLRDQIKKNPAKQIRQIVFTGEKFDSTSLLKLRRTLLASGE